MGSGGWGPLRHSTFGVRWIWLSLGNLVTFCGSFFGSYPLKRTIPNLAANFSRSLFLHNYVQEVVVNICWGINKPQRKTSWGHSVDGFSERSLLFLSPLYLPEEGISLCFSFGSSWVPGWVFEEVCRLINLGHCNPGVFDFGREVYKCHSRCNCLAVTSEEYKILRNSRWQEQKGSGVECGCSSGSFGLSSCPAIHSL